MSKRLRTITSTPNQVGEIERIVNNKFRDDDYINVRFIGTLRRYDNLARTNANSAAITKVVKNVVYAMAPVIVGLEAFFVNGTFLKVIALLLTFVASVFGSDLTIFNAQARWRMYSSVREALTHEFYLFHMGISPYPVASDHTLNRQFFAARVEAVIGAANRNSSGLYEVVSPQNITNS